MTGCWEWTRCKNEKGYGLLTFRYKVWRAHRLFYTICVGPVPEDMELDHLCRNRWCCNPDHLEPVTHRENLLRGGTVTAKHAATTHCPKGHAYTEENTYRRKNKNSRECRVCIRSRNMEAKRVRSRERRLARTNAATCADAASGSASP